VEVKVKHRVEEVKVKHRVEEVKDEAMLEPTIWPGMMSIHLLEPWSKKAVISCH
jgi:hypothetical protein